jgi:hypothetical protein
MKSQQSFLLLVIDHLEIIKAYTQTDGTTSIWTTESFTDIDVAITTGKALYA